jgi:hypothetical protein
LTFFARNQSDDKQGGQREQGEARQIVEHRKPAAMTR